jgi:hypothetical protein
MASSMDKDFRGPFKKPIIKNKAPPEDDESNDVFDGM